MPGREQSPVLTDAIRRHGFLGYGLASGIDDTFPIGEVISSFHGKELWFQLPVAGNRGCHAAWKNIPCLGFHIAVLQVPHNSADNLNTVIFQYIKSTAHRNHIKVYDFLFHSFITGMSIALLQKLNLFRSFYLTWLCQKDYTAYTERSSSFFLIQHTDFEANHHVCQSLIPALRSHWGRNSLSVRKYHVSNHIFLLPHRFQSIVAMNYPNCMLNL